MTVREFYDFLCERIPVDTRQDTDYDGMICCPCPDRNVEKVLICLDVTDDIIDEVVEEDCQVILTHHPLYRGALREIGAGDYNGRRICRLVNAGICAMSFHTRLDGSAGGVGELLAKLIGVIPDGRISNHGINIIGHLEEPVYAAEFAARIKEVLGAPFVQYTDTGRPIKTVAVAGGGVGSYFRDVIAAKADAFVGGEMSYHDLLDSKDAGFCAFMAGHFFTENPVCAKLFELTVEAGAMPIMTFSNSIETI